MTEPVNFLDFFKRGPGKPVNRLALTTFAPDVAARFLIGTSVAKVKKYLAENNMVISDDTLRAFRDAYVLTLTPDQRKAILTLAPGPMAPAPAVPTTPPDRLEYTDPAIKIDFAKASVVDMYSHMLTAVQKQIEGLEDSANKDPKKAELLQKYYAQAMEMRARLEKEQLTSSVENARSEGAYGAGKIALEFIPIEKHEQFIQKIEGFIQRT